MTSADERRGAGEAAAAVEGAWNGSIDGAEVSGAGGETADAAGRAQGWGAACEGASARAVHGGTQVPGHLRRVVFEGRGGVAAEFDVLWEVLADLLRQG